MKTASQILKEMERLESDANMTQPWVRLKMFVESFCQFRNTFCSQCGKEFGPGDSGFSHCENHHLNNGRLNIDSTQKDIDNANDALGFVVQYLYSEHGICSPEDDAAPYTPEELKEMATNILDKR